MKTESGVWQPHVQSSLLVYRQEQAMLDEEELLSVLEITELMRETFAELGVFAVPSRNGLPHEAAAGDILIELGEVPNTTNAEAYRIEIGEHIRLIAMTSRAILYGLRSLLQLLSSSEGKLEYGAIEDEPVLGERSLHLDIGRKFYSKEWIIERVHEMSELKLNTLQLHFSEHEGFTFESERFPDLMSERYLTKIEIREIMEEARKHRITLIPSLDSPGHLDWALRNRREWLLTDQEGVAAKGALDITNPKAVAFVMDLIDEYAELFADSPYFHIGGDEFIDFSKFDEYPKLALYAQQQLGISEGTGVDAYIHYLNTIATHLENKDFTVRVWNDGLYREGLEQRVALKTSIQITYWTKWDRKMALAQTFVDQGHQLINFNDAYFYYVLGEHAGYTYPTGEKVYEGWTPGVLPRIAEGESQEWALPYPTSLLGCSFSVWSDKPTMQTAEAVASGIREPLRAMAEKAWTGEKRYANYEEFKQVCQIVNLKPE
nr:family 20 glycosylhydrolase [Saccharibacillus sp. JS10]